MAEFVHRSCYPHPVADVFAWHQRPGGFIRLTPPGWATLLSEPTDSIFVGSQLRLRISAPLLQLLPGKPGADWLVRHVAYDDNRLFVDEQISGPMRLWRHEHHFEPGPDNSTVITDVVYWQPPPGVPRVLLERRLERMFAFRERQLRHDLSIAVTTPMTVLIAGASGLVGTQLAALLATAGHRVIRLVRGRAAGPGEAAWDPAAGLLPSLDGINAVVNLAGHTIGTRFTPGNKRLILDSRIAATKLLARACVESGIGTLLQASAVGFFGARRPGEVLTERSARGMGFLADVVDAWEAAAAPAYEAGVRTAFIRTGIALSMGAGALLPQLPLFLAGAGGRLAARDAWLSWITIDDLVHVFAHALHRNLHGPLNAVAPQPVTQQGFAIALGSALHRPAWLPVPSIGPKLLLGAEGYDQLINTDQRVAPEALLGSGFHFAHPNLTDGLNHILAT